MTLLKGIGHGAKTPLAVQQLEWLEVDWFYTWGQTPNEAVNMAVQPEFIPMLWSAKAERIATLPSVDKTSGHILGFNEPDLASQSNMTVDQAIAAWTYMKGTGLRLGSPATISPNAVWMDQFMAKAATQGLKIDFVTAHIYQNPHVQTFLTKLDVMYEKWGKPVWVTETAVADFSPPNTYTREETNDYLLGIWEGCKARPWVERFAWKTREAGDDVMPTSTLFHSDGELTSTGRLYASLSG